MADNRRTIYVGIRSDGTYINVDKITPDVLGPTVAKIMETRAEKVLFVYGDPEVSYQEVVNAIDRIHSSSPETNVALISHFKVPTCGFTVPDSHRPNDADHQR